MIARLAVALVMALLAGRLPRHAVPEVAVIRRLVLGLALVAGLVLAAGCEADADVPTWEGGCPPICPVGGSCESSLAAMLIAEDGGATVERPIVTKLSPGMTRSEPRAEPASLR